MDAFPHSIDSRHFWRQWPNYRTKTTNTTVRHTLFSTENDVI